MKTYCAVAAPIAMIFKINDDLLSRAVDGLTNEELWHSPTDKNNPMLWLLGHVTQTRSAVLRIVGEPFHTAWGDLFSRGARLQDRARYPTVEEIMSVLNQITQRLYAKFESLDDARLALPAKGSIPLAETLADQLTFLAFHESYHVGQIAYARKALGRPGLVG
jgi:uncharacterized damage-inducible protein DinB